MTDSDRQLENQTSTPRVPLSLAAEDRVHVRSVDAYGSVLESTPDRCRVLLDDGRELACDIDQVTSVD